MNQHSNYLVVKKSYYKVDLETPRIYVLLEDFMALGNQIIGFDYKQSYIGHMYDNYITFRPIHRFFMGNSVAARADFRNYNGGTKIILTQSLSIENYLICFFGEIIMSCFIGFQLIAFHLGDEHIDKHIYILPLLPLGLFIVFLFEFQVKSVYIEKDFSLFLNNLKREDNKR